MEKITEEKKKTDTQKDSVKKRASIEKEEFQKRMKFGHNLDKVDTSYLTKSTSNYQMEDIQSQNTEIEKTCQVTVKDEPTEEECYNTFKDEPIKKECYNTYQITIKKESVNSDPGTVKDEPIKEDCYDTDQNEISMAVKQEVEVKIEPEMEVKTEIVEIENSKIDYVPDQNEIENSKIDLFPDEGVTSESQFTISEDMAISALADSLSGKNTFKIISDHLEGRCEESVRKRYFGNPNPNKCLYGGSFLMFKIYLYCNVGMKHTRSIISERKKMNTFVVILTRSDMTLLKCKHDEYAPCISGLCIPMLYKEDSEFGVDLDFLLHSIKKKEKEKAILNNSLGGLASILRKCRISFHPENKPPTPVRGNKKSFPPENKPPTPIQSSIDVASNNTKITKNAGSNSKTKSTTIWLKDAGSNQETVKQDYTKKEDMIPYNDKEYKAILSLNILLKYSDADVNAAKIISNHIVGRTEDSIRQVLPNIEMNFRPVACFKIPVSIILQHKLKTSNPKFLLLVSHGDLLLLKCKDQCMSHSIFQTSKQPNQTKTITMCIKPDSNFGIDEQHLFMFLTKLQLHVVGMLPKTLEAFRQLLDRCNIRFHDYSKSYVLNPAFNYLVENAPLRFVKTNFNKRPLEPLYNEKEDMAILALTGLISMVKQSLVYSMFKIVSDLLIGRSEISIQNRHSSVLKKSSANSDIYIVLKIGLTSLKETIHSYKFLKETTAYMAILSSSKMMILKCKNAKDCSMIPARYLEIPYKKESEFGLDTGLLLDFIKKETLSIVGAVRSTADGKLKTANIILEYKKLNATGLESLLRKFDINFHPNSDSHIPNKAFKSDSDS